ncbi:GHMP kinase [Prolixibacteraceae bacterium JC049]|nr:GHMP kinase [Prolixibacteraceae bacterium JC049]
MNNEPLHTFYSNGKLLITGEYAVLNGARALAVPLRFGQEMIVNPSKTDKLLTWEVADKNGRWFSCKIQLPTFEVIHSTNQSMATTLTSWLQATRKLQPQFLNNDNGYHVSCTLQFDKNWGWGSSSTAIANLAKWAKVDPFHLNRLVSKGSGYDIACANHNKPIIFQLQSGIQTIEEIDFQPAFSKYIYLVWLGVKKDTNESITHYQKQDTVSPSFIDEISALTDKIAFAKSYEEFATCLNLHKTLLSMILKTPSAQEEWFNDFSGIVKYLGAWGGDFVLATSTRPEEEVRAYFQQKNLPLVFKWDELVIE